ncbi:hypothetical protein [Streptomyces sp. NPDC001388]|uniref:hypothetical protein n=1 Tax=Streptomyces sp. NPDC001388 TaxID=3364568 RepID=UPI0036C241F1
MPAQVDRRMLAVAEQAGIGDTLARPGDTLGRTASPYGIPAPEAGPPLAVPLNVLGREGDMIDRRR